MRLGFLVAIIACLGGPALAACPSTTACESKENAYSVQVPGADATVSVTKGEALPTLIPGADKTVAVTKQNEYVVLVACSYSPQLLPKQCSGLFFQGVP